MHLSIITPEKTFFSADAEQVDIPGSEGDMGVLPGHMPLISTLREGLITVQAEGKTTRISVQGGIAEITPDHCTILAEGAQLA